MQSRIRGFVLGAIRSAGTAFRLRGTCGLGGCSLSLTCGQRYQHFV
ncbi:hypothetical protein [Aurantiacibacter sp. MUD61]|nr:hypothetical protein [Aurantiacibacter sp. MUD61]